MDVYNLDVVTVYNKYNRFIEEVQKSNSANASDSKKPDVIRLKSYVVDLKTFLDHVASKPEMDAPETNPKPYALREPVTLLDIENESCAHICRHLEMARDEIAVSQTARNSSGIIHFDYKRQVEYLTKIDFFVTDYVEKIEALDLPDSSPRSPVQGLGKNTLNP